MKKKILLVLSMALVLVCLFVLAISAESVHSGKVDLKATVTLENGTVCNLFDDEGNALIWYMNGTELQSIRADDSRVKYKATYGFNVGNDAVGKVYVYEASDMWIALESGNINKGNIVVLNLMDDDVKVNEGGSSYIGGPVNCVKTIQWANKILEYAFLRLDTAAIQQQSFNGCTKLKYVNVEDLSELRAIGGGNAFGGCSALFAGQVLDLTGTKLVTINGNGAFNYIPVAEIKLPATLVTMDPWNIQGTTIVSFAFPTGVAKITGSQFNDCKSLKTIYINKTTTVIEDRAFNNTALEKIFYVGTLAELNALLDNSGVNNNVPFWNVVGENRANLISYEEYQKLADKSGKYVVYNYSYCEAYNDGVHTMAGNVTMQKVDYFKDITFADTCTVCQGSFVDTSKTIASIFTWKGYSAATYGTGYSVVQGFYVNKSSIDAYLAYAPDFNYGILATVNEGGEAIAPKLGDDNVLTSNFDKAANDYLDIKVTGIPEGYAGAKVVFCVYITVGEKMYYLDNNTTGETITGISYSEVVALNNN